jgi:hypothetical protein
MPEKLTDQGPSIVIFLVVPVTVLTGPATPDLPNTKKYA